MRSKTFVETLEESLAEAENLLHEVVSGKPITPELFRKIKIFLDEPTEAIVVPSVLVVNSALRDSLKIFGSHHFTGNQIGTESWARSVHSVLFELALAVSSESKTVRKQRLLRKFARRRSSCTGG